MGPTRATDFWLSWMLCIFPFLKAPTKRLTGPAEAGGGELLERVSLEQCLFPEHKTPAHIQVNVGEGSHPERVKVYGPRVEKTGLKANEPTYFTVDCSEAGQGEPLPRGRVLGGKGLVHWDQLPGHSSRSL